MVSYDVGNFSERGIFWNGFLSTGIFSFEILREGIFCHVTYFHGGNLSSFMSGRTAKTVRTDALQTSAISTIFAAVFTMRHGSRP